MFLIVAKYLIPNGYRGMAVCPFVLMKHEFDKADKIFVNHEKIHLRQQIEMLILPFFIWYFLEYLIPVSYTHLRAHETRIGISL